MTRPTRGRESHPRRAKSGDRRCEMSLIDNEPHSATVRAEVQTDMLILGRAEFARCLPENSSLSYAIMRGLVQRLRSADRQIESLALLDVYGRVARTLLDMSEMEGDVKIIRNKVSRQDLAKVVGASREMVSRVMKDLEGRGMVQTQENGWVAWTGECFPADARLAPKTLAGLRHRRRQAARAVPTARASAAPSWRAQLGLLVGAVAWTLAVIAPRHSGADTASIIGSGGGAETRPASPAPGSPTSPSSWSAIRCGGRCSSARVFFGWAAWRASKRQPRRTENEADALLRWPVWLGLGLLLTASASLEWTRLYQHEAAVAGGNAGGVLGYALGKSSQGLLGFAGSGVLWIAALVAGVSLGPLARLRAAEHRRGDRIRCARRTSA